MSGTVAPAPGERALSRVLLLEDHPLQHLMLRDGLASRLGERAIVCACHRLDEALAALADGTFDALFTDWALPGGSAAPAISRFRKRFPVAPIIVYTAHVEDIAAAAKLERTRCTTRPSAAPAPCSTSSSRGWQPKRPEDAAPDGRTRRGTHFPRPAVA